LEQRIRNEAKAELSGFSLEMTVKDTQSSRAVWRKGAMLYIRMCVDRPDGGQVRDRERASHRAYLASGVVKLVQAGPLMADDDSRNIGSFMVVEADSLATVKRFHDEDPFTKAGLFDDVRIHRWDKHIG
jgi:uncharacterized protein